MTQGRDGISLATTGARRLIGVARRLSVVAAVFMIAALVAGTVSTSHAAGLNDTVVVTNNGSLFAGSLATFPAGSGTHAHLRPQFLVKGSNTFLGASGGPTGDAVSSLDHHIAVAIPLDFLAITAPLGPPVGCGPFGQPAAAPLFGTGLVELFSPSSTGNSAPEAEICSPNFAVGAFNTTGIFYPQGVAFESPFDGITPAGHEILAVANEFPQVTQDSAICAGAMLTPVALGTITEYDRSAFTPGLNNVPPTPNNPISAINPFTLVPYTQNSSIGGCLTSLAGPVSVAFDENGFLFVVNNAGKFAAALAALPRFVSVFQQNAASTPNPPFSTGDVFPLALIGIAGTETAGDVIQPVGVTVLTMGFEDDLAFVTDVGDNSIKIFNPFTNPNALIGFAFAGELVGTIHGGATKLKAPEGIALSADGDTLYVVNNTADSLSEFTDVPSIEGGGNIAPTLIIQSNRSKLNLPVGVAVSQFTPTPVPTESVLGAE
jgi:DNA-binding beta-propeller fold protein YncE